jgi:peptide/nickel transport system permease protein
MSSPDVSFLLSRGVVRQDSRRTGVLGRYIGWTGILVVGIGLVLLGTMGLSEISNAWPRWTITLGGLGVMFKAIDALCVTHFGEEFQTGIWLAGLWVALVIVLAVLAPILPFEKPTAVPQDPQFLLRPDLFSSHPLGTDALGRDYFSRIVYGARISLLVGVGCTLVGLTLGTTIGLLAGFYRGKLDGVVRLVTDALLAFPPLVFLLALVAFLRPGLKTMFIAFAILTVPTIIRLSRASTLQVAQREFVQAESGLGASKSRIIRREVLPNVLMPLMAYAMVFVAALIVAEASLSFLGLGITEPTPSWGNMIAASQTIVQQHPHTLLVPSIVLLLTVFSFNRLGEAARGRRDSRRSALA